MKITIELDVSEHDLRMLRSWASVGRLIDSAVSAINTLVDLCPEQNQDAIQDGMHAVEDLSAMKGPLNNFHGYLRPKLVEMGLKPLWDQNQK